MKDKKGVFADFFKELDLSLVTKLLYLMGFMLLLIFVVSLLPFFDNVDFQTTAHIGDSLGGFTAPIIGLLAVITTFLAFVAQYKANEEIRNQFKHERFETKFYELLRLHQHNVSEMEIDGRFKGRKAFVKMYDELRFIYAFLLEERLKWNNREEMEVYKIEASIMETAYTIFFFGLDEVKQGFETNTPFQHALHTPFVLHSLNALSDLRDLGQNGKGKYELNTSSADMANVRWCPSYKPFGGHVSKLGHYYRHLYQLVKYVSSNNDLGLSFEQKYEYIKTVRAQLSNHEQALIYFNSFFVAGRIWWAERHHNHSKILRNERGEVLSYFLDYRIIKNLPLNLTKFGPQPIAEFTSALEERGRTKGEIAEELKELLEWIGG
ncbi:MAG: putative phage abortive infection protein [Cyclobacteriaceae bacterium]